MKWHGKEKGIAYWKKSAAFANPRAFVVFGRGRTYLGKGMPHKTSFRTTQLQISNDCGVKTAINKSNFPILKRLAIYRLTLNPECFREPHWQAIDARVTMPWQSRAELRIKLFSSF